MRPNLNPGKSRAGSALLAALPLLGAALAGANANADNTITFQGSGVNSAVIDASQASGNNVIDIYQVGGSTGPANQAGNSSYKIVQSGGNNTLRVGQGASYSSGWTAGSAVTGNLAAVQQIGGGTANTAAVYQSSDANTAKLMQYVGSTAYTMTVTQGGTGSHVAEIATVLNYAGGDVSVTQTGSSNTTTISGMSGGSANITQNGSSGSVSVTNQSAGNLQVSQGTSCTACTVTIPSLATDLSVSQNSGNAAYPPP